MSLSTPSASPRQRCWLHLTGHPNHPVESLGHLEEERKRGREEERNSPSSPPYLQCIADGQSHQARVDPDVDGVLIVALDHRKESGKEDDEVTDKLQTNGKPPAQSDYMQTFHTCTQCQYT